MDWNFVVEKCGLPIRNITQVPVSPGYYLLFAENGDFIYVGKAKDLRNRLTDHFGLDEENERINGIAEYAIWIPTQTIAEAEEAEGHLYDIWVRNTGRHPAENKNKPPKSKLTEKEIRDAKYHSLLRDLILDLGNLCVR